MTGTRFNFVPETTEKTRQDIGNKIFRTERDTCTPVFIAALFTITRTWKQPKCQSTKDWIKKMWSVYAMEYYSAIKRTKLCHLQQHGWT